MNTAEGTNALKNLTSGVGNAAVGWYSLFSNSSGNYNTGVGAGTLALNDGEQNTASGAGAVLLNTTGGGNKIATLSSARRYKEQIAPMEKASETCLHLSRSHFATKECGSRPTLSFGLIAEDVAQISQELVTPDLEGKRSATKPSARCCSTNS